MIVAACVAAAAIVPLVVKLKAVLVPHDFGLYGYANPVIDGFSWYKAQLVEACAALALAGLAASRPTFRAFDGICLLLAALITASAWCSNHQSLGLGGVPYMFEGWLTSLAYLGLAAAATRMPISVLSRWLPLAMTVSALVIAPFALAEATGYQMINEKWFIKACLTSFDGWQGSYLGAFGAASVPFGNPNYTGMYAAMVLAFLSCSSLASCNWRRACVPACGAIASAAILLASLNRTGLIAAVLVLIPALLYACFYVRPQLSVWMPLLVASVASIFTLAVLRPRGPAERLATIARELQFALSSAPAAPTNAGARDAAVFIDGGRLRIEHRGQGLLVERGPGTVKLMDLGYRPLFTTTEGEQLLVQDPRYHDLKLQLRYTPAFPVLTIRLPFQELHVAITNRGFRIARFGGFVTPVVGKRFPLPLSDHAFSQRGFIWARTLPLLAGGWWLGQGPSAFPFAFPNGDPVAMDAEFGPSQVVDKPHQFYLGFAFAHGVLALTLLLGTGCAYVYFGQMQLRRRPLQPQSLLLWPYLAAFLAFAVAALACDGAIGVAAPFWVLFGCGVGQVQLTHHERHKQRQEIALRGLGIHTTGNESMI